MTNKALIITIGIFQIAILILAGLYLNNIDAQAKATLNEYSARKEDLILKQQRIESLIVDLNNSLSYQKAIQQNLADKLSQLQAENATISQNMQVNMPSVPMMPSIQMPPVPPTQTSQPAPPIRTRAS